MNTIDSPRDQPVSACVPVTALQVIKTDDGTFLLSGCGGLMSIWKCSDSFEQQTSCRVFAAQAIHGFKCHVSARSDQQISVKILVWGGRCLSICGLHVQPDTRTGFPSKQDIRIIRSHDLDDWILDVVISGSGEEAYVLTAHNAVLCVDLVGTLSSTINLICDGLDTLLYSGCIKHTNNGTLLVASGTVFGEIVVWICSRTGSQNAWKSFLQHIYLGHRGSIFGVSISESIVWNGQKQRVLASCSDDRTIRLWDVCEDINENEIVTTGKKRDHVTGFGTSHNQSDSLAIAWGHLSRIWNVTFLQEAMFAEGDQLALLSRGEDGVCQYWSVDKRALFSSAKEQPTTLNPISHDRHHAGKNIWSWTQVVVQDGCRVLTGGADGQIVARVLQIPAKVMHDLRMAVSFAQILASFNDVSLNNDMGIRELGRSLKQYLMFDNGVIIATTDTGGLLRGSIVANDSWSLIIIANLGAVRVLSSNQNGQLAIFATSTNQIAAYDVRSSTILPIECDLPAQAAWMQIAGMSKAGFDDEFAFWLVVTFRGVHAPQLISVSSENDKLTAKLCSLNVPTDFVITSSFFDEESKALLCGSRAGAMIVSSHKKQQSVMDTFTCARHIHGSESVTSIMRIPRLNCDKSSQSWYLTTGRDGTYAVHLVSSGQDNLSMSIKTLHRAKPPFGPQIEGSYLRKNREGKHSVILYGFKSRDFVVWDESRQKRLLAVNCGGAYRNWHFRPSNSSEGIGTFVWTKAATFNAYDALLGNCDIVQPGGHGREIKGLAVSSGYKQHKGLIATGAEDTDIRLFDYNHEDSQFDCTRVLQGHTTGLQHLRFSCDGKFLFSSGGCEEMYVWQLHEIPFLGLGVVLIARLPKEAEDSDARIMCFDLVEAQHDDGTNPAFQISLAYSNGKIKLFSYLTTSSRFELQEEISVGMTCLTQTHYLNERYIVAGATDGCLKLIEYPMMKVVLNSVVHQNNIAGMAVVKLDVRSSLILTGGDDSALGFTLVEFNAQPHIQSCLVTDGHAAAVTFVVVLDVSFCDDDYIVLVASAGNDQKVKIWKLQLVAQTKSAPSDRLVESGKLPRYSMKVERIKELWTDIADISNMEVMNKPAKSSASSKGDVYFDVLVVGIGMQILRTSIGMEHRK